MAEFILPYKGPVYFSSPFGRRMLNGETTYHNGIDLVGRSSKLILAPCGGVIGASGIVTDKSDRTWEWGNFIRIDTADGRVVFLCHLSERTRVVGERVEVGDVIGVEGDTGYSFGSHCHVEVRVGNVPVDPCPYFGIPNESGVVLENAPAAPIPGGNVPHEWARDAVEWAIENGILLGSSATDPRYRLDDTITREEALVFLYRAAAPGVSR